MKQALLISIGILFSFSVIAQEALNISLLSQWSDSTIPPTNQYDNPYNEVWGYATEDAEYAIIGSTMGTHIIDVTDPTNINEVAFVEGAATGVNIVHRDYHDYAGYLYMVCQEGQSTLQIADLSYLPDSVHIVYDSNALIKGAHNIFIDEATAKLYAMDVYPASGSFIGLRIISLEDPINPTLITDRNIGSDVHDIFVRNDTAFLNRGWNSSLEVYDFADTENPILLGSLDTYEGQGYNHSGYLSDDGTIYIMGDETHGSPVKILDVSDLSDMEIIATMSSEVASNSIPHNQLIKGDLIYSSYYYDGVYVWNFSDPLNPELVGFYDTSTIPNGNGYYGCWGVYPYLPSGLILASDMQNGLFVLEMDEANAIEELNGNLFDFSIYPNPAKDHFFLSFNNELREDFQINIYSISGSLVHKQSSNLSTTAISTENLDKGIYFIEMQGVNTITKKLVVN